MRLSMYIGEHIAKAIKYYVATNLPFWGLPCSFTSLSFAIITLELNEVLEIGWVKKTPT
jgi:hypothetical protein